ncbi:hypothetical protein NW755_005438 [Fusarium falciforme]|uniref:Uncharacterized protein n=1 Tax=Fusarium falciforme TaxID=195108 RepID=A0A9W8V0W7_9HYPO|nr:hypothetical protein NW755_005438 [Fusarium falciforme]
MNFKTEPVKTESVNMEGFMAIKRELVPFPNKKAGPSVDADNEVVFLGTTLPPSAPPLGTCSCGRLCDHVLVPVLDTKPVTKTDEPFAASSRALEVIDLISDDKKDVYFYLPPTRKEKERA